jgi:hypothetical protein
MGVCLSFRNLIQSSIRLALSMSGTHVCQGLVVIYLHSHSYQAST